VHLEFAGFWGYGSLQILLVLVLCALLFFPFVPKFLNAII
jgi:hypothetical protein